MKPGTNPIAIINERIKDLEDITAELVERIEILEKSCSEDFRIIKDVSSKMIEINEFIERCKKHD